MDFIADHKVPFEEVKKDFFPRFQNAKADAVIELAQTCRWFSIDVNGVLIISKNGSQIIESNEIRRLQLMIKSFVESHKPPWSMLLSKGRVTARSLIPSAARQCFEEAELFETSPSSLKMWDELCSVIKGRDNSVREEIGRKGEKLTKLFEFQRTGVNPRWISLETDFAGYDFISKLDKNDPSRMPIEVKATERKQEHAFVHISKNEWEVSQTSKNYVFYFWILKDPLQLFIVQPKGVIPHSPVDKGDGSWESVKIPYASFAKGKKAHVQKIEPIGLSLKDLETDFASL